MKAVKSRREGERPEVRPLKVGRGVASTLRDIKARWSGWLKLKVKSIVLRVLNAYTMFVWKTVLCACGLMKTGSLQSWRRASLT